MDRRLSSSFGYFGIRAGADGHLADLAPGGIDATAGFGTGVDLRFRICRVLYLHEGSRERSGDLARGVFTWSFVRSDGDHHARWPKVQAVLSRRSRHWTSGRMPGC